MNGRQRHDHRILTVGQGECAVSDDPATVLTTVLGSCVACCLFDAHAGIGGMNHFLLPQGGRSSVPSARYGAFAMERLINEVLKGGAQRPRLKAKLFGGARMTSFGADIGRQNMIFVQKFLQTEEIEILSHSLGGENARSIRFWPVGGRAQQRVSQTKPVQEETPRMVDEGAVGDVDLF